jgi:urea transport system permease protein
VAGRQVVARAGILALLSFSLMAEPGGTLAAGSAPALEALARRLADPETQRQALREAAGVSDAGLDALLRALKEGGLYLHQGRPVLLADDGSLKDLAGQPVLESGQPASLPSGQEAVGLDESLFGAVQTILQRLEVFSGDAATRRSAAFRLGAAGDGAAIPLLGQALEREQDAGVRAALAEALAKLQLAAPDPTARLTAVRSLDRTRSEAAIPALRAMAEHDADPGVRTEAQAVLGRLEAFLVRRNLLGYLFNGASLGAVLLIMSVGLSVTFGLMGIINMAHGEMLMIGSYTAYVLQELFAARLPAHQDYFFVAALPLAFVVAGLVGFGLEVGLLRFLYQRPLETLIVTWGIGLIVQQSARLWFGDQTSVSPPKWFRGGYEILPGLIFPWSRIFIIGLALVILLALALLFYRSYTGLRIRAVMQNRSMASCLGVSTRRVDALTFALGTALAGVAGCALSLIGTVDPEVGKTYIVDSFMVVVLGGVGKLVGTVVASLGIGLANKLLEPAIGGTAAAIYAKVAILGLVITFIQWRPTGLRAARGRAAEAG